MRIVIFGPPGAGKGTQARLISDNYDIPHLSTGEIFRSAIKNKTPLGKEVKAILDAGDLVPDQTVVELVKDELTKEKYNKGYVLDGFPRTVPQAESFDDYLHKKNQEVDAFIYLKVPEEELINRILSRGEGRTDDTEDRIKKRLQVYRDETEPVFNYYKSKGVVKIVDGIGSINDINNRIRFQLESGSL